jgi:hypothetical protein
MLLGRSTQAGLVLVTVSAKALLNGKVRRRAAAPIFNNVLSALALNNLKHRCMVPLSLVGRLLKPTGSPDSVKSDLV